MMAEVVDLIELTRNLIDIPSVTGDESAVGRFLVDYLQRLDYEVEIQELSPGRANILATTNSPPRVVLSTHLDTVPPHIASREDAGFIYGRGACDAKGIVAAQIAAAERLRGEGESQVGLLFLVDEEQGGGGARAANHLRFARSCRYLVNGEPTENRLATGSKGSLRVQISARGRAAHSAYPEMGESAIDKLLDVLSSIRSCPWPNDDDLGETTCNIGVIEGGTRPNVVPADARAELQIRLVTGSKPVLDSLERAVAGRARLEVLSVTEPVRLLAMDGFDTCMVRFTTDIPHLTHWGTPLLLGPGSILDAHTPDERVAKSDLVRAVDLYTRLVRNLLARQQESPAPDTPEGKQL